MSENDTIPFPNRSTESTHAAAAPEINPTQKAERYVDQVDTPGTVTEFKSVNGIDFPVNPRSLSFSGVRDLGDLPEPFNAWTFLVFAS